MRPDQYRLEIASRVLAGFASNPAIFAHNSQFGWGLVNSTDSQLAAYALQLATELIEAEIAASKKSP